jgi:hypothetical protein
MRPQAEPSDEQVAGWLRDYAERGDPADRERIILAHTSQQIGGARSASPRHDDRDELYEPLRPLPPHRKFREVDDLVLHLKGRVSQLGGGVDHPGAAVGASGHGLEFTLDLCMTSNLPSS